MQWSMLSSPSIIAVQVRAPNQQTVSPPMAVYTVQSRSSSRQIGALCAEKRLQLLGWLLHCGGPMRGMSARCVARRRPLSNVAAAPHTMLAAFVLVAKWCASEGDTWAAGRWFIGLGWKPVQGKIYCKAFPVENHVRALFFFQKTMQCEKQKLSE